MNGNERINHSTRGLRLWLAATLLWTLGSAFLVPEAAAEAGVKPDRIEVTLNPGECSTHPVTVTTSEAPVAKADVILVIDVTGSMKDIIREVQKSAGKIVSDIRQVVPDTAFALATLADYPAVPLLASIPGADYPWRLDQGLTEDEAFIQSALDRITLVEGGDGPESYLRALYETQFLPWHEGARRLVLLFGDSTPHDPDLGRDAAFSTDDDLSQSGVISQLAANNITVLGIYTNSGVRFFYEAVATGTGGESFGLDHVDQVREAIQKMVIVTASRIHDLTLAPTETGKAWLSWDPIRFEDVGPATTQEFALKICAPVDAAGGQYDFDLQVLGDAVLLDQVPIVVHVPPRAPTSEPTKTPVIIPTATHVPIPPPPPPPPDGILRWWWVLLPLLGAAVAAVVMLTRRSSTAGGTLQRPEERPERGRLGSGPVKEQTALRSGSEVTHGQSKGTPPPTKR